MTESIRSNAAQCRAENAIVQLPASRIHVRLWYGVSKDQTCFRVVLTPPRSLLEPPGWVRTWVLMVASSRVLKGHLGMPRCRGVDCIGTWSRSHVVGDRIHWIVAVAVPLVHGTLSSSSIGDSSKLDVDMIYAKCHELMLYMPLTTWEIPDANVPCDIYRDRHKTATRSASSE